MKNLIAQAAVACAPMRAEAADRSEMVNQLLIGELADIIDETDLWVQIIKKRDGYKGWCNKNELFISSHEGSISPALNGFNEPTKPSHFEAFRARNTKKPNHLILVPPGAPITHDVEKATLSYLFGDFEIIDFLTPLPTNNLLATALAFLGTPYLWGGLSTLGIDCSGFTQTVAALHGLELPRDASQQAKLAKSLTKNELLAKVKPADLLFFNPAKSGAISHVGFYLGSGLFLHASGCVRVDSLLEDFATSEVLYNQRYGQSLCGFLPLTS